MLNVVITRFNIASPGREAPIRNTPGWLDRRFELFERYCLPSIAAQTVKNFHWLIYFDEGTPAAFRERIESARAQAQFEPRFVGPFTMQMTASDVSALISPSDDLVVTTRLDNDDAVSRDFIERVRLEAARVPTGTVLNFTNGLALRDGRVYTATDTSNPFTSLVESASGPIKTIWSAQHHKLESEWTLHQIRGLPAWLQVVHGENVSNRIKGCRVSDTAVVDTFALGDGVQIAPAGPVDLALDKLIAAPLRTLREQAFRAIKPWVRPR